MPDAIIVEDVEALSLAFQTAGGYPRSYARMKNDDS